MEVEIVNEASDIAAKQPSQLDGSSSSKSADNDFAASSWTTSPTLRRNAGSSGRCRSRDMDLLLQQAARLGLTSDTDKFLHNFNPENSNRERRKLTRKIVQNYKRFYDSKGVLIICNKDLCDCLNEECPGCFFPCPKCRSCKCGHECRQFRKWVYESAEVQGSKKVIHNKYKGLLKKKP